MQKVLMFGLMNSFHQIFTVFWIGGLLTTAISLMPVIKNSGLKRDDINKILKKYQSRLRIIVMISVVVLWITGFLLAKQSGTGFGFLSFSMPYHTLISIKHIIVIVMTVIAVFRGFILGRKVENFTPGQQKTYGILLFANAFLGIVVLILSGFSAALA